jgi:hypothetical protein
MLQSDDPGACVLGCARRVGRIDDSVRSGEVQQDRDLAWREVPLAQWPGQEAPAREVTQDVLTKARFRRPLRRLPATEIRLVSAPFDSR